MYTETAAYGHMGRELLKPFQKQLRYFSQMEHQTTSQEVELRLLGKS